MWVLREHGIIFRNFKIFQLLLTIIILSLEIIQITAHTRTNENEMWFQNSGWNSQVKIWVFFVILITTIGLAFYIFNFKRVWSKGPFLWIDIILTTSWLTATLANLDPLFKNSNDLQCGAYDSYNFHLMCQSWITSIVFTWINMILFIISIFISSRVNHEKQKGLHSFDKPQVSPKQKKMTSNRQSVLLKQTLDNPDKPQPVMLETGFKPLMLPIMVDNDNNSNDSISDGSYKSRRNSMVDNNSKRFSNLLNVSKKRLSMIV